MLAKSYARTHRQNLVNFGVHPMELTSATDFGDIDLRNELAIDNVVDALTRQQDVTAGVRNFRARLPLTPSHAGFRVHVHG